MRYTVLTASMTCVGVGLCLLAACTSTDPNTESLNRLHHHNWWNYYQRGVERLEAGDNKSAREDFEIALGLRPGAKFGFDRDSWRVRTYGMHYLPAYFPNRELGLTLFRLGEIDEAEVYLKKSLEQAPSGRAKYYLNDVHRDQVGRQSVEAPSIKFSPEVTSKWTRLHTRTLSGVATGDGFIGRVVVDEQPQFIELADRAIEFSVPVRLRRGHNLVNVTAEDLQGKDTHKALEWMADWTPPLVSILSVTQHGAAWSVVARATDNFALSGVRVDGSHAFQSGSKDEKRCEFSFEITDAGAVRILVSDKAGNRLEHVVSVPELLQARRNGAQKQWVQLADDAGINTKPSKKAVDGLKPSMRLSMSGRRVEVFEEEFYFDGTVQDGGGVMHILLNGENVLSNGDEGAIQVAFSRRLSLEMGVNQFTVLAADMAGNEIKKTFEVIRKEPDYLDEAYRLSVGVPPLFVSDQHMLDDEAKIIIEEEVLRSPPRFHLLERDEGWDYILREQELSLSDLSDPRAALRISKMLPAEMLLMGGLLKSDAGVTVYIKVVDSEDGRVLLLEDVYSERLDKEMHYKLGGLVMKIEQHFPLIQGQISEFKGDRVMLNVGGEGWGSAGDEVSRHAS